MTSATGRSVSPRGERHKAVAYQRELNTVLQSADVFLLVWLQETGVVVAFVFSIVKLEVT